jgi:biotin transport system substrate-specific component
MQTQANRQVALIVIFAALTAAGAFIRIPVPPVPITLQNFFVIMAGLLLGSKAGMMSQVVYIIMGLLGLPVFSGGGGIAYVVKPSFGYLLGFILAPGAVGLYMKNRKYSHTNIFIASILGMAVIYLIGVPYLALYMHYVLDKPDVIMPAIKAGLLIFLPGDILKCVVLAAISGRVLKIVKNSSQP